MAQFGLRHAGRHRAPANPGGRRQLLLLRDALESVSKASRSEGAQ